MHLQQTPLKHKPALASAFAFVHRTGVVPSPLFIGCLLTDPVAVHVVVLIEGGGVGKITLAGIVLDLSQQIVKPIDMAVRHAPDNCKTETLQCFFNHPQTRKIQLLATQCKSNCHLALRGSIVRQQGKDGLGRLSRLNCT
jgi:hypothetical protein